MGKAIGSRQVDLSALARALTMASAIAKRSGDNLRSRMFRDVDTFPCLSSRRHNQIIAYELKEVLCPQR